MRRGLFFYVLTEQTRGGDKRIVSSFFRIMVVFASITIRDREIMNTSNTGLTITLKNLTFHSENSDETMDFTADVELNGIPVGKARNKGRGGQTLITGRRSEETGQAIAHGRKVFSELPEEEHTWGEGDDEVSISLPRGLESEIDNIATRMINAAKLVAKGWKSGTETAVVSKGTSWRFPGLISTSDAERLINKERGKKEQPVTIEYRLNEYAADQVTVAITEDGHTVVTGEKA